MRAAALSTLPRPRLRPLSSGFPTAMREEWRSLSTTLAAHYASPRALRRLAGAIQRLLARRSAQVAEPSFSTADDFHAKLAAGSG